MRAILYYPRYAQAQSAQNPQHADLHRSVSRQRAIALTLACDAMFLLVAIGVTLIFRAVVVMTWSEGAALGQRDLVRGIVVVSLMGSWLWFILRDGLRSTHPTKPLPFEYTDRVVRHLYTRRLEWLVWAAAVNVILCSLCAAFPNVPLFSKVFMALVFGLSVLAVRKSIPNVRVAMASAVSVFIAAMILIAVGHQFAPEAIPVELEGAGDDAHLVDRFYV